MNFIFIGCGEKEDDTKTKKDDKTSPQTQSQQQTQQTQSEVNAPKIGKIWEQIEIKNEALGKVIQSKKAHHLDEPIAEIINLVKTLPSKSVGLEQSKLDLINKNINELVTMGNSIDELHHDKKDSEVLDVYGKFSHTLYEIKILFPPESFM